MILLLFVPSGPSSVVVPTVTTVNPVASVLSVSAYAYGVLVSDGGGTISQKGFVLSRTNPTPTLSDTVYLADGDFEARLTGLRPANKYYVRAFATNEAGTSYGDVVEFTTIIGQAHKEFIYKVYDDNVFIKSWSSEVINQPKFTANINNGAGEIVIRLARRFDDFGEDQDIKLNNVIKVYVVDREAPNGVLLYTGYISGYRPVVREAEEFVEVTVFGLAAELGRMILTDGSGNTTVVYNSYDPSDILRDIIDKYRSRGGRLRYTSTSIMDTNTEVSYTFNTNTVKECLDKVIELCPDGWYFVVGADGVIYLRPRNVFADHVFTLGKDVESLETHRRIEDLVNRVLFTGGGTPPLFRVYENTGSQDTYGLYELKKVDQRVTDTDTSAIMSNRIINAQKDPEIRSKFEIIDSNARLSKGYDIESILPGQSLKVKNLKSGTQSVTYWDQALWDQEVWDQTIATSAADVIQILSITYEVDSIIVEASSRIPQIAKRIEDINRNLQDSQTVNNPTAPS